MDKWMDGKYILLGGGNFKVNGVKCGGVWQTVLNAVVHKDWMSLLWPLVW